MPATADAFSRSECAVTGIVSTIGPDTCDERESLLDLDVVVARLCPYTIADLTIVHFRFIQETPLHCGVWGGVGPPQWCRRRPRPRSGRDCLTRATFGRQRGGPSTSSMAP